MIDLCGGMVDSAAGLGIHCCVGCGVGHFVEGVKVVDLLSHAERYPTGDQQSFSRSVYVVLCSCNLDSKQ
jgi:hypothetical protein